MCTTVLQLAQFTPNVVEAETYTVNFGPTGAEGQVVLWSNREGMDDFFIQTSQTDDDVELEIKQFFDYTDGYAVRLKYSFLKSLTNAALYGACLTNVVEKQQSCWAFTQTANVPADFESYYETTNVADSLNLDSGATALVKACEWNAGWNRHWTCSYTTSSTTNDITCDRFLPSLVDDASPTDDFRFAPNNDENPDKATGEIAVWVYGVLGAGTYQKYPVVLLGANELVATAFAGIALLVW